MLDSQRRRERSHDRIGGPAKARRAMTPADRQAHPSQVDTRPHRVRDRRPVALPECVALRSRCRAGREFPGVERFGPGPMRRPEFSKILRSPCRPARRCCSPAPRTFQELMLNAATDSKDGAALAFAKNAGRSGRADRAGCRAAFSRSTPETSPDGYSSSPSAALLTSVKIALVRPSQAEAADGRRSERRFRGQSPAHSKRRSEILAQRRGLSHDCRGLPTATASELAAVLLAWITLPRGESPSANLPAHYFANWLVVRPMPGSPPPA